MGIDSRFLSKIAQGTGTYTSQLIGAFDDMRRAGCLDAFQFHLLSHRWRTTEVTVDPAAAFARKKLLTDYTPLNVLAGYAWASKRYDLDLIHTNYLCSVWPSRTKKVMTIHDILFRTHPEYFPRSLRFGVHLLSFASIRSAHGLITVSEYSRSQIERYFPASEGKIRVIPEAPADAFHLIHSEAANRQFLSSRFGLASPYILYVGRFAPIKNLDALLDFIRSYGKRGPIRVVLVGDSDTAFPSPLLEKKIRSSPDATVLKSLSLTELNHLYNGALFVYFVSFGEGFGLPILEAMAAGTPVLTSNTTACSETAGDAAIKVNPFEMEDISGAMRQLIHDASLRLTLKKKGLMRAKGFSWKKCAEQTLSFYRKICHESP